MSLSRLRNIGIVAHIDAGKTTVSERILFYAGIERRMGEVHEGTAVMDWMDEERRRGITITAAATTIPWGEHTINLIDTPGHVDFTVEVERSMRVLDGAVLVINAVGGVQAQSETVWRQMQRHHVRCIGFVNQLDRPGADFQRCLTEMRERLGAPAVAVQLPIGEGRDFRAIVDLVRCEAWEFPEEERGRDPRRIPIPPELEDEVGVMRSDLIEALAEEDEEILGAFLDEREPEPEALMRALRRRVGEGTLVPVLCGAALRNVGIQPLLDAVVSWLPAPDEVPPARGIDPTTGGTVIRAPERDAPLCAFVFKLAVDPHEDLVFARVYSGTVRSGQKLFNPRVKRMERVSRVLRMHADARTAIDEAGPGDIVALTGCKWTATGDTFCEHDDAIVLEALELADPVITRVVEPRAADDRDKLRQALERLQFEDPSFRVREDEETGQWLIAGMGELHLEIKEHLLAEFFKLEVKVGRPRVAYREAVRSSGSGRGRVDRLLGGKHVVGAVDIEVLAEPEPTYSGAGLTRVEWHASCLVPASFRPALEEALVLGAQTGPRFGFPLTGARIRVLGGQSSPERESELGFVQAGALALREALQAASVALLEPVMSFEIEAPSEFMSGIIGELNAKRADITDLQAETATRRVVGTVPLYTMFGYATTLRSLSQGRASFSLAPAGFRPVPEHELEARGLVWH